MARTAWENSDRRRRLPPHWADTAARILRRDNRVCHVCGGLGADAVDHLIPGDDHSDTNLAAIHQDLPPYCHRKKSAQEGVAARRARPTQKRPSEPHPGFR